MARHRPLRNHLPMQSPHTAGRNGSQSMDNDSKSFNHALPAGASAGPGGFGLQLGPASDGFADIGYEAADPSLQCPLWCAAMHALPAGADSR